MTLLKRALLILLFVLESYSNLMAETIKIGILSTRPDEITTQQYKPLKNYLEKNFPSSSFEIIPLDYQEIEKSISLKEIDYLLTNPENYIHLRKKSPLKLLATRVSLINGHPVNTMSGTIIVHSSNTHINSLEDIQHTTISAPNKDSLGGFNAQKWELIQQGINIEETNSIAFLGMPHDKSVYAVLDKNSTVGFVRAGVIESMAKEGKLNLNDIKVINSQRSDTHPTLHSTEIYPEWPLLSLQQLGEKFDQKLTHALISYKDDLPNTQNRDFYGFSLPMDYAKTEALVVKLTEVDTLITFKSVFQKYSFEILSLISFSALIGLTFSLYLLFTRKKLKKAILTIENILEHESNLLNSLGEGVYGIDLQGKCTFINQMGCDILGYTIDEVLGEDNHLLFHHHHMNGECYEKHDCPVHKTTKDLRTRNVKDWFLKKDGTFVPVKLVITPINENGVYTGAVVAFTDITEKLKIKDELINKEEQLRLAFETTGDGLWDWDVQSGHIFHNARFQEIMGIVGENIVHTNDVLTSLVHPDDLDRVKELLISCRDGDCNYSSTHRIIKPDNTLAWIHDRGKVVKRDENSNPLRIVGSITDITEQKLAQLQLSQLNDSLEEQISEAVKENQKKDYALMQQSRFSSMGELISNIAHQWRQPLNTISIKQMLLADYYHSNELEKDLFNSLTSEITQEIRGLSTTIDNFRTFFASSNEPELINVNDTINESFNLLVEQIQTAHVTLEVTSHNNCELYCVKNEFQHVLIHLLKNSLDIFEERGVSLPVVCISTHLDDSSVVITYDDNGGGVSPEKIDMIFDPYFTTKFQSREKGLGLYVTKLIINHHLNGTITAKNNTRGLEFTISIPTGQEI